MKSFKFAMSVLTLIPTLSQAQTLNVEDKVTRPAKPTKEVNQPVKRKFNRLGVFKMGGIEQRVRVFLNEEDSADDNAQTISYDYENNGNNEGSPQFEKVQNDPLISTSSYAGNTCLGNECSVTSTHLGFGDPSIKNKLASDSADMLEEWSGMIIYPQTIMCLSDALRQVKRVMDANPNDTKNMGIEEVNIILNVVSNNRPEYLTLQRADVQEVKNDPALNYSLPVIVNSQGEAKCGLASDAQFLAAWQKLVALSKK